MPLPTYPSPALLLVTNVFHGHSLVQLMSIFLRFEIFILRVATVNIFFLSFKTRKINRNCFLSVMFVRLLRYWCTHVVFPGENLRPIVA